MIVGIDVYHEKGKQLSSVVGIIASMDKTFTEWCTLAAMQKNSHQELVKSIQDSFHKAANLFKTVGFFFFLLNICILNFIIFYYVRKTKYYRKR